MVSEEFCNGMVYAVLALDEVPRAYGMSPTEVVDHPDGTQHVTVKTSFDIPPQSQERIRTLLTPMEGVTDVRFERLNVEMHG
jgi:hypothetical protein